MIGEYDVIVVGAGPAGSAAALSARRSGLSVAIVDQAVFPRDKLCGGLVSGRGLKRLHEIFGLKAEPSRFLISRKAAFCWRDETLVQFDAPNDLCYTMRRDFDFWLHRAAADAGCDTYLGQRGITIDGKAGRVVLADGTALGFRFLIGADGANSAVARHLFGQAFDPGKIGFTLETEAPRDRTAPEPRMWIDFGVVDWGYGWRFPKLDSTTIGVGGIKAQNPDIRDCLNTLLLREGVDPETVKIKGAFIPLGDFRRNPCRGNILLAGDAAGLVDPLTGEGIAFAMESGQYAARAVAEALASGQSKSAARLYRKKLAPIHKELAKAVRLRQFAFSGRFRALFKEKLRTSERMRLTFFALLEGDTSYGEIEKMAAGGMIRKLGLRISGWPAAAGRANRS